MRWLIMSTIDRISSCKQSRLVVRVWPTYSLPLDCICSQQACHSCALAARDQAVSPAVRNWVCLRISDLHPDPLAGLYRYSVELCQEPRSKVSQVSLIAAPTSGDLQATLNYVMVPRSRAGKHCLMLHAVVRSRCRMQGVKWLMHLRACPTAQCAPHLTPLAQHLGVTSFETQLGHHTHERSGPNLLGLGITLPRPLSSASTRVSPPVSGLDTRQVQQGLR